MAHLVVYKADVFWLILFRLSISNTIQQSTKMFQKFFVSYFSFNRYIVNGRYYYVALFFFCWTLISSSLLSSLWWLSSTLTLYPLAMRLAKVTKLSANPSVSYCYIFLNFCDAQLIWIGTISATCVNSTSCSGNLIYKTCRANLFGSLQCCLF